MTELLLIIPGLFARIELYTRIRLYAGIAEWLFCLIFIILAKKRLKKVILYLTIVGFAITMIGFQLLTSTFPLKLWILRTIFAFLLMFLFIYTTTKQSINNAGYITVLAFVISEFATSLYWHMYRYTIRTFNISFVFFDELFLVLIYGLVFLVFLMIESRYLKKGITIEVNRNDFLSFASIGIMIFLISNISFISSNTPLSGRYPTEILIIRMLVDFAGILILYSQREHKLNVKSKMDLNAMETLLYKQYEQYRISQDSINIINQKYHDLKNQIIAIRTEKDADIRKKYLEDLENSIKYYEAQYKTGNEVLDTILTSKLITCLDNNIIVTCIADGKLLNFISAMDLCSIFGNAIDNAIESVLKIDDKEKRLIKIATYAENELLLIRFENFYLNPLQISHGNFVTTKKDTRFHGYRLKSIKSTVEKYGGNVSITTSNNWFRLIILIPIPRAET
ncbi:MAG: GHKL domain-containing protein [Candidatus Izemoplasmatales bacterium]|jgi:hypothetical protein